MNCLNMALTFALWSVASVIALRLMGGNPDDEDDEK
jgi:hypothetical protein